MFQGASTNGGSRMTFLDRMRPCLRGLSAVMALLFSDLFCASLGEAEIYKWNDPAGRLHFAQDLNQVPPEYRSQAKGEAIEEGGPSIIQRYDPAPAAPRSSQHSGSSAGIDAASGVYRIPVQKTGSSMQVNVRINDLVTAAFVIDTGASDVSLPEWVANELALDLEGARTGLYSTANGTVQQALVMLESVELAGARVENVPAHVNKSMSVGLLGLSFFNHFQYDIDPASGVVTLRPNGLVESGQLRGGRSEEQWRGEFARMAWRRVSLEQSLEDINPNKGRRKSELQTELEEVDRQLSILEGEADDAHVPAQWRD